MVLSATAAAVLAMALLPGTSAAQSLADAREERASIQQRLDTATDELGEVQDRVATLEAEAADLEDEAAALTADVASVQDGMQEQIAALYKRGSVRDPVTVFLTSDDPREALLRAQAIEQAIVGDLGEVEALAADRRRLEVVTERLAEQEAAVRAAVTEQGSLMASLTADLERAQELEERLEEEDRRRREAEERERREAAAQEAREREAAAASERGSSSSDGDGEEAADDGGGSDGGGADGGGADGGGAGGATSVGSSGMACPVGSPRSFSDTWGAPRSGGRGHRGTDVLAPYGTPVYAIVSGTWSIQSPGASAGLWAILRGDDGNQYWYMHLQSHTVGGGRVEAGQQVATNGDTGNARGTPHVHFELHPGGGGAINPYPTLRGIC